MDYEDVDNIVGVIAQPDGFYALGTTLVNGCPCPTEWGKLELLTIKGDERLAIESASGSHLFAGHLWTASETEDFNHQVEGTFKYHVADLVVAVVESPGFKNHDILDRIRSYGIKVTTSTQSC